MVPLGGSDSGLGQRTMVFASVGVGASALGWVALDNAGGARLSGRIDGFAAGSPFSLLGAGGWFVLDPGERLWVGVRFRPAYAGSFAEPLLITTGQGGSGRVAVPLRGVAQ
ncbi:MAG: hypothetical protein M1336_01725 [Deltaproteobacteria bacterium]|nr:hypothetical protein [Deltaproteobacteria bacterium]